MKTGLLTFGLVLALCGTAQARTTITCEPCSFPYQRWVDEAKVPTPNVGLAVAEASCPDGEDVQACTEPGAFTIWWDISPPAYMPRETFLHELGHNFDFYVLPEWGRVRFSELIGDPRPWHANPDGPDESFASTYADCAMRGPHFNGDPNLLIKGNGAAITQHTFRAICRMIGRIGLAEGGNPELTVQSGYGT